MSQGIQSLRAQAEAGIAASVKSVNDALSQIDSLNRKLGNGTNSDLDTVTLKDLRDNAVNSLAELMDIQVVDNPGNNGISIFTSDGIQLVGGSNPPTLSFNAQATVTANTLWNPDPTKSSLGTITATFANGSTIDLLQSGSIRSGTIAADVKMRDSILPLAENQIDQVAAKMASLLSDKTTPGVAVGAPPAPATSGFDLKSIEPAEWKRCSCLLQRCDGCPAPTFAGARRRSNCAAAEQQRQRQILTIRSSGSISRVDFLYRLRRSPRSIPGLQPWG